MTFHPTRYIGFAFTFLVLCVVAPPVADWLRANSQLPPGYGAEEDRRRAGHIPATAAGRWNAAVPRTVQTTVEEQSVGAEASWVKETVENGEWVYELHLLGEGKWSVVRIAPNGNVIRPHTHEPLDTVEAGD